jgi:uncharacterized damage-inducible protein DinB
MTHRRPDDHESHDYFKLYINQVTSDDFLQVLENNLETTVAFLENIPAEKWDYRYAEGKWSIKEAFIHVLDTERIFAYRALRLARNDRTPMPGFNQDDYIAHYNVDERSPFSIIEEYKAVRKATLSQFSHFTDEMLDQIGTASGHAVSTRALGFMIAGHEIHHLRITRERYLDEKVN